MIESRTQVTVRYAETDMMGVVYHGNYLPWFEVGRTTLLKELGLAYRRLEEEGFRLPVLEVSARYLRPAVYDDTITIVAVGEPTATEWVEHPVLAKLLTEHVDVAEYRTDGVRHAWRLIRVNATCPR